LRVGNEGFDVLFGVELAEGGEVFGIGACKGDSEHEEGFIFGVDFHVGEESGDFGLGEDEIGFVLVVEEELVGFIEGWSKVGGCRGSAVESSFSGIWILMAPKKDLGQVFLDFMERLG